jgi:FkbM family methyltransferase
MKNETRLVNIQGMPMIIHGSPECISDDIVKYNDFWEFGIFNGWKSHFPATGLMLDIGANIGSHCVQFHKHFPKLNIWAFELHHGNFELLRKNTLAYPEIFCFNIGVGSCTSIVHYSDGPEQNSGGIRLSANGHNTNLVMALDNLITPEPVKFIKIDIEEHELSAFEGMKNLLLRDKPLIWLEDFTGPATRFLMDLGYEIIESVDKTSDYLMKYKSRF